MKRLEKLVVAAILLLSFVAMGIMTLAQSDHQDKNIIIKVDNKLVKEIPINNSNESKIYSFNFNNHTGYIESKSGKVRMLEMSKELCPNGICSDTGWIDKSYQSIVCLPNKIVITVEGKEDNGIDVIP